MKKALLMVLALLFMASTSSLVLAADSSTTPTKGHKGHKKHHKKPKGSGGMESSAPSTGAPASK